MLEIREVLETCHRLETGSSGSVGALRKQRPQDHWLGVDSLAALAFNGAALRPPVRGRLAGGAGV